jgi:hypothetical protein
VDTKSVLTPAASVYDFEAECGGHFRMDRPQLNKGTASVRTGSLLAAVAAAGGRLRDQRAAILGAGSAG